MKAVICTKYGPPEVLQLTEVEKPIPKDNEVLIKIHATTVTASDCIIRGFKVHWSLKLPMAMAIGFRKPRRPILGMVCAGEIEAVGQSVTTFKPGDQIFACDLDRFVFGMYAEYLAFPDSGMIALKPANMNYEESVALPYGVMLAMPFLRKGRIHNRKNVLIYGASGAIGTAAVQLAKYFGARVTGVCSSRNVELVQSLGADAVIDYTKESYLERGMKWDLILNAVGKAKVKLEPQKVLTEDGQHITVDDGNPKPRMDDFMLLRDLAESGHLKAVIDKSYRLEDMAEAHRYVDTGHKRGNVVITITPNSQNQ